MQWEHSLHVVHDDGGTWVGVSTGPSQICDTPPYAPGDVCLHDEGYLAAWADGGSVLLLLGRHVRTGQRTAIDIRVRRGATTAGPTRPPWEGTLKHVVCDPSAGTLSAPTVLLDGVVSAGGQVVEDGAELQLLLQDHVCDAFASWAARIAALDCDRRWRGVPAR